MHGDPGTGKSRYARLISKKLYGEEPYIKHQNKWWDSYQGQKVIILDDFDMDGGQCLGHHLKIWGDRYACTGEVKGSHVQLRHRLFIITSNYTPDEIYSKEFASTADKEKIEILLKAIKERFHMRKFLQLNNQVVRKPNSDVVAASLQTIDRLLAMPDKASQECVEENT